MDLAGVTRIDAFANSHYHEDHFGGIDDLVEMGVPALEACDRGKKEFVDVADQLTFGGLVTFTLEVLKQRRESADRERQDAVDTLSSLLNRLDSTYRSVKRTRKRFRVAGLNVVSKSDYVDRMSTLSDDKQEVEQLWRDIEVLEHWLSSLKRVRPRVRSMEDYLNPLEDEWEKIGEAPADEFHAESLEALNGFSVKGVDHVSTFEHFRMPYYEARALLITALVKS